MRNVAGLTLRGMTGAAVEVEAEITGGMPTFAVVGLPDTAVKEARERVRAALRTVNVLLRGRVSVNLAPADLPKEGAMLDLPIAVALAEKAGRVRTERPALYIGELALDGRLRGVRGAVPAAFFARENGMELFVPPENAAEVSIVEGVRAWSVPDLQSLVMHLRGEKSLETIEKREIECAAPAADPDDDELMEVMMLRSTAGLPFVLSRERPFRAVHHTATTAAICGGGSWLRPGEISLASRGVLFLDEFPEFQRDVIEALRQPLEDGSITVSRVSGSVTYPAKVLVVAACNPCPCGYAGDPEQKCICSAASLERYRRKLSGPILDRIDLHIPVPRLTPEELVSLGESGGETSAEVRARVTAAREIQRARWKPFGFSYNSEIPEKFLRRNASMKPEVRDFILETLKRVKLSGRGLSRVLRVARTIADLEVAPRIEVRHVAEAAGYREGEATSWMNG